MSAQNPAMPLPPALFRGLSAFPLTPANADGVVDADALGRMVDRLAAAGVDSIGLLGSTGGYAYLDRSERDRAVDVAVEAVAGRTRLVVGVGALRTDWACGLARRAEWVGADGLLLAPMSYLPLTEAEAAAHFRAVAGATALPLCIYNNPTTTNFRFSDTLVAELAAVPGIAAIKMPLPADGAYADEMARLRPSAPPGFAIGYSGDWGAAPSLLAGGDAWYSVIGGLLPVEALRLTRAAMAGRRDEAAAIDAAFGGFWALFRRHGSLRIVHAAARLLDLPAGDPPLPVRPVAPAVEHEVADALAAVRALG